MLTVMTTVLNPAQIMPCQYGEELSVAQVQRVPKPQSTDNWHIHHLPPKCLAHAEKSTQLAGGPGSVLLREERTIVSWLWNYPLDPQSLTGSYLNLPVRDRKPQSLSSTESFLYNLSGQKAVCALPTLGSTMSSLTQEAHGFLCSVFSSLSLYPGLSQNPPKTYFIQLLMFSHPEAVQI